MSEPLTPEQIDDYERHDCYPSFIATIREREAALGQLWSYAEKSTEKLDERTEDWLDLGEAYEDGLYKQYRLWKALEREAETTLAQAKRIKELEVRVRDTLEVINYRIKRHENSEVVYERLVASNHIGLRNLLQEPRKQAQPEEDDDDTT